MASRSPSGRRPRPGPRPYGCRVKRIADSFTWPLRAPLSRRVFGILAVLLLPLATAAFAARGKPADLFNFAAALRGVRRDFATWNVVVGAIVTAWAIGLACAGLLCVGVVPGVFYAILVSAHAAAALQRQGSR